MKTVKLTPCPDRPNCVSSLARDSKHYIAPLRYRGPAAKAFSRLKAIFTAIPRTRIVMGTDDYLKIEFKTRFLRFVDIVEIKLNEKYHTIDIRSASTIGYWDLGVNRNRVEEIRKKFKNNYISEDISA